MKKILVLSLTLFLLSCNETNEEKVLSFYKDYYEENYCKLSDLRVDGFVTYDTKGLKQDAKLLYDSIQTYNLTRDSLRSYINFKKNKEKFSIPERAYIATLFMFDSLSQNFNLFDNIKHDIDSLMKTKDCIVYEYKISYQNEGDTVFNNDLVCVNQLYNSFYVNEDVDCLETDTVKAQVVYDILQYRNFSEAINYFKEFYRNYLNTIINEIKILESLKDRYKDKLSIYSN